MSITWDGRLRTVGATAAEITAITLSYSDAAAGVQQALDALIAGIDNVALSVMLATWRGGVGPFGDGFPGGGLPFGTEVAILTGNPADDGFAISAGTGSKLVVPTGQFLIDHNAAGAIPFDSTGIQIGQVLGFNGSQIVATSPVAAFTMRGVYASGTTYAAGDGVTGSDGRVYVSLAAGNVGHDPTTDAGVHWVDLLHGAMLAAITNTITKFQQFSLTQRIAENRCLFPRPGLGSTAAVGISPLSSTLTWPTPPIAGGPSVDALGTTAKIQWITVVAAGPADQATFPASSSWRSVVRPGELITPSRYIYQPSRSGAQPARQWRFNFRWYNAAGTLIEQDQTANTPIGAQDAWVRLSAPAPVRVPDGIVALDLAFYVVGAVAGDVYGVDAELEDASGALQTYGDGATSQWGWSGTAFRSSSQNPAVSDPVYWVGHDATGLTTVWHIDSLGKAYVHGIDGRMQRATGFADPVDANDLVTVEYLQANGGGLTESYLPDAILGPSLVDVFDKVNVNVFSLRDNYAHRERSVSEGVFGDVWLPDGKVIITGTNDDGVTEDYTMLWPLIRALGIPWALAIVSNWIGTSAHLTWDNIRELRDYGGCEMVCHSADHVAWASSNNMFYETIGAANLLAAGPGGSGAPQYNVDSFTQPGVWTGGVEGNIQLPVNIDPPARFGYVLRSRFSVVTAYITDTAPDPAVTAIPVARRFGLSRRVDLNSATPTIMGPLINQALAMGGGIISMHGHSAEGGTDWTQIGDCLTYLAAQRDAGNVVFMTPCAAFHAKPSGPTPRRNLMADGDFHLDTPGTIGSGGALIGWYHAGVPTIIASGAQAGSKPSPASGSCIINTTSDSIWTEVAAGPRFLMIEFDARTKNASTDNAQEVDLQCVPLTYPLLRTVDFQSDGSTGPQWPSLTAAWQHFRCYVGLDPQADQGYKILATTIGTGGVELANVAITKT